MHEPGVSKSGGDVRTGVKRRSYLLGATGLMAGLAGGVGSGGECVSTRPDLASLSQPSLGDVDLPVDKSAMVLGTPGGKIPAIEAPAFADDWSGLDRQLPDTDLVVGVERGGEARAYPLAVLNVHEVVNDAVPADGGGEEPLLVTFCPLCSSGVTAVRRVDGRPTTFSASGYLFRSDLVLVDHRTRSLWSQLMATAVVGDATGAELRLVPSTLSTWGRWREAHPDTSVLLPPPASGTVTSPVSTEAVAGSAASGHAGVTEVGGDFDDDRLPKRELVVGVDTGEAARAYPLPAVEAAGVVNDCLDGLPVTAAADQLPHAYVRWADGPLPPFERVDRTTLRGGGSEWLLATGEAVSGPHEGQSLPRANYASAMFWFAWLDFNPETTVYGVDA